jgi:hypothetical protein
MWFNLAASGASDASDRDWWVKYRDLAAGLAKAIGATAFSRRLRCPKARSLKTSASMSFSQFRSARDRRLAAIPRHPSLFPWTIRIRRWSYGNAASTGIEKDQTGSTCVFAAQSGSDRYLREGDVSNRRSADVTDRGLGRLNWAEKRTYRDRQ